MQLSHLKEAVTASGQVLHKQAPKSWLWNGYRVMLVDGTTFLMPDTDSNQKTYPQQSAQKPGLGFPIVRMVGLLSLATGSCIDYAIGPYQGKRTGETSLFSRLIQSLGKQDLLLSFMAAVQLMRNMTSLCITMTGSALGKLMPALLMAITQTEVGKRKRPNQPRVIKRIPKAYSLMVKRREKYATS